MADIHPSALIAKGAEIHESASIGPYCVIGAGAVVGKGARLISHVALEGRAEIGEGCLIYPFASIGMNPQIYAYDGKRGRVRIGARTEAREHVSINAGSEKGGGLTSVGEGALLMAGSHIAHDCQIGNETVIANGVTFGGHCVVGDYVVISGFAAIQQFKHIGAYAFIAGMAPVSRDVPPFTIMGRNEQLRGVNRIGLRRRGFSHERVMTLRKAYDLIYRGEGLFEDRLNEAEARFSASAEVMELARFLRAGHERESRARNP